ncbi:MAG: carbamoyl-phosphate synthase large subunit [Actinomycetes bacterium]
MPRRTDLHSILILGSGPIVIGQACEFDYSGTQACRALRREGYRVILVNSNPATIMTDPEFSDATYIEPLVPEVVEKILERERPDALLPTVGGQTGINLTLALDERGALKRLGVEVLGANVDALRLGEDRLLFKQAMEEVGLKVPRSGYAGTLEETREIVSGEEGIGYPVIIRPSFTLGGEGGGVAYNREELEEIVETALQASPVSRILVEQSVLGWKEFELEVMRDLADNAIVVCSVENVDAMGVHTGDSITVAPQQTLSDREYQDMRDDAFKVIRRVGVATGGSNIQFAVHPGTGERVVIEMNPRVSRSSALASKATGFPIAKIAALLAVGYTLDEVANDITGKTYAAFEPTLDYTVVKIPRWAFEKFPQSPTTLGTSMKSVGEVMAIGGTFGEALMKGLAGLELDGSVADRERRMSDPVRLRGRLATPNWERLFAVFAALRQGWTVEEVAQVSHIDPWFLREIQEIVELEAELACWDLRSLPRPLLRKAKMTGLTDARVASLLSCPESDLAAARARAGVRRVYKRVDTCAAEFPATTPYLYSTFGEEDEAETDDRPKVVILGSGPNRIGQGIEFDYCCVHAALALREAGFETVMLNCNPETVSTDYDTSDRLYFEPLTLEHVLAVIDREKPQGVIVQLGGQTPLKLARGLAAAGVPIWGTPPEAIDLAEDRGRFGTVLERCRLDAPPWGQVASVTEALAVADRVGYPVLVRPSYVLGGRSMEVCYDADALARSSALSAISEVSVGRPFPGPPNPPGSRPVLVDRFLEDAVEVDVDALCDAAGQVLVCGVMEHIEEAGIHSGDSACVLPPITLGADQVAAVEEATARLGRALGVVGVLNVQFAFKGERLYVLEANPRASRSVPFVEKVTGLPVAKAAALLMTGSTLAGLALQGAEPAHVGVKEAVLPFARFPGADSLLGPEMRSTGEVLGLDARFGAAFAKSQEAAYGALPTKGVAFLSVRNADKRAIVLPAKRLADLGFTLVATTGTAGVLHRNGVPAAIVRKGHEGPDNVVDKIRAGEIDLVVNTPAGPGAREDGYDIRIAAVAADIPCITTLSGLTAVVQGIEARLAGDLAVRPLQTWHKGG